MSKSAPLRWIESAEARRVLTAALSEMPATSDALRDGNATLWGDLLRR